jgi:hypothetical protein
VLFGHYWLNGLPGITASNVACLDFSVAKKGYLTAYRWSGETQLSEQNLISVAALVCMYKKTNRFMIGSRRGWGNQGGGGPFDPKKPSNRPRKKTRSTILAEHKILVKKQAERRRILKEQQRSIVEKKALAALREAVIASAEEHKRLRLEAEFQKAQIRKLEQLASKERNASGEIRIIAASHYLSMVSICRTRALEDRERRGVFAAV